MTDRLADYAPPTDPKFRKWMRLVDAHVDAKIGLSVMDLPDVAFADWFADGVSAKSAASRAIRAAGANF